MKVSELFESQVDEGAWDYVKGVGQHVGNNISNNLAARGEQILKPIRAAHQAGVASSQQADVRQTKEQFKKNTVALIAQLGPLLKEIKALKAQQPTNRQTNEGMWDYMRGVGKAAGQSAQRGAQSIQRGAQAIPGAIQRGAQSVQQGVRAWGEEGRQTSIESDIAKKRTQATSLMSQLVQAAKYLGPTGQAQIIKAIKQYYEVNRQDRSTSMTLLIAFDKAMKNGNTPQQAPTSRQSSRPARGSLPTNRQQGRVNPQF